MNENLQECFFILILGNERRANMYMNITPKNALKS